MTQTAAISVKVTKQDLFAAAIFGTQAFMNGAKRVPHLDNEYNKFVYSLPLNKITATAETFRECSKLHTEWLRNYDLAMLNSAKN
jgi:hypothetical protein